MSANVYKHHFSVMASQCEIHIESEDVLLCRRVANAVVFEAKRIEAKFSRYVEGNVVSRINSHEEVKLDDESARLIDFSFRCHAMSDGLFDITTGVLRQVWDFRENSVVEFPSRSQVKRLCQQIGLEKVHWMRPYIRVPENMEIDLGGIGKEYAADSSLALAMQMTKAPCLVNLGGDLVVSGPRAGNLPWIIAIEPIQNGSSALDTIHIYHGAIATSGNTHKYFFRDHKRYGHILNPKTGFPVCDAPLSVTVQAGSCTEAGILSTLAMLKGPEARSFLKSENIKSWVYR